MAYNFKTNHTANLPGDLKKRPVARHNKHNAKRVQVNDIWFDSRMEAKRYGELLLMEMAGVITDLATHPTFLLQEAYTDSNGKRIRKMEYEADFRYKEGGKTVVEDVKGFRNRVFLNKWKMFRKLYPELDGRLINKET